MDVNEYMKRSLELQERTALALEALVKAGFQQVNVAHHSCGKTVGGAQVKHPEADKPAETKAEVKDAPTEKTNTLAGKSDAGTATAPAGSTESQASAPADTAKTGSSEQKASDDKPKKVTADDARKALKAYAAVEGNDAAMELLTSMGASSVSALAEQGEDKLRELVAKCEGK